MEMPIKVMITLFVAIIVGFTVITFSRQIIDKSKLDLERNRPGLELSKEEEQKIVELNVLDNEQVINLAVECYNSRHSKMLEKDLCFVVIAKGVATDMSYAAVVSSVQSQIPAQVTADGLSDTDYALKIYYDPIGTQEKIILSR